MRSHAVLAISAVFAIGGLLTPATVPAAVPSTINYQGRLTDAVGLPVPDGTYSVRFSIYDVELSGAPLWAETLLVPVSKSIFTTPLGGVHPLTPAVFTGADRWLGTVVGADQEMTPRQKLTAVPYAFHASGDGIWSESGADAYRAAGNVGIGTSDPQSMLQIGPKPALDAQGLLPQVGIYGGHSNVLGLSLKATGDSHWYNQIRLIADMDTLSPTWIFGQLNSGYGNTSHSFGLMYNNGYGLDPNNPKMALSPRAGLSLGDDYGRRVAPANGLVVQGLVGIGTYAPVHPLELASGAHCTAGGTWTNASDATQKENYTPIDRRELLDKIAALPIMRWNYRAEGSDVQHIGPTAQDFRALFGVGSDGKSISTVDPAGIALAAIQELYQKSRQIDELRAQIAALQEQIETLTAKSR